jgi:hypothetical protein
MQRIIFTLAIFGIAFIFTTSILWGHIESVIHQSTYQSLAKAGLLLVSAVALIMVIWELFVDKVGVGRQHPLHPTVVHLINFCFWGASFLLVADLVHAGALLKYESSAAEQKMTISAVGDAQAKIAGATAAAAIEASGRAARDLNANGQRHSAQRVLRNGQDTASAASAKAQEELSKAAEKARPDTFLPQWYIDGGMYAALPVLAALCFILTMFLARRAAPFVDADDDGRVDAEQEREKREGKAALASVTSIEQFPKSLPEDQSPNA